MNKTLIINKIKSANNLTTDSELAVFLGVKKNTISNWRARNTIDWELVLSNCDNLDLNWLIKDEAEEPLEFKIKEAPQFNNKKSNNTIDISTEAPINVILDMYKDLAIEYGYLKKENEIYKKSKT